MLRCFLNLIFSVGKNRKHQVYLKYRSWPCRQGRFFMRLFKRKHRFTEWKEARKHCWLHYSEIIRWCEVCGLTERSIKDFFCPTKRKTGKFCYWCVQWEQVYLSQVDETEILWDFEKLHKGRPEKKERNKQIVALLDKGLSYGVVSDAFGLTKPTVFAIAKRTRLRALAESPAK